MSYKTFQNGFPLPASDLNNYLMNQVVATFANSTARSSAIASPQEGQVTYLEDSDSYWRWNGSAWVSFFPADTSPSSPNYIINGAFDIWQRGTSFTSSGVYTADRFRQFHDGSGVSKTISRQTFTPNALNATGFGEEEFFFRYQVTSAGTSNTYHFVDVLVEDVRTLAGQTATLSFWAKSAGTSPIQANIIQNFGTGGSTEVDTPFVASSNTSTAWNRFSATITIPSISGKTVGTGSYIYIRFSLPANTTFTMDLWGVQLEAGSNSTNFRRNANSIQGELANCMRYYQRTGTPSAGSPYAAIATARMSSSTEANVYFPFIVPMRTAPTSIDFSTLALSVSGSAQAVNTMLLRDSSTTNSTIYATCSAGSYTTGQIIFLINNNSTSAFLGFSAEL